MQAYDDAQLDPPAPLALVAVNSEQLGIVIHDIRAATSYVREPQI